MVSDVLLAERGQTQLDGYCSPCLRLFLFAEGLLNLGGSGDVDLFELGVIFCEISSDEEGFGDIVSEGVELYEVESFEKFVGDVQVIVY